MTEENLDMKHLKYLPATIALFLAATSAVAATSAQQSFDSIKALQGTWEGKTTQGKDVEVSFRPTSGDSAVISEIRGGDHGPDQDMITMFHMDGPNFLMTHYCSAGNQPRMTATASPDGKTITFDFRDATNLSAPDAGHMQRVIFTITDSNHHVEEWHFVDHGREIVARFDLTKKS
jgi:carbohydrate-selective porin OprB